MNAKVAAPEWPTPGSSPDSALGAVLGALAGDAAGAVLELLDRTPRAADVERALAFPGGGVWMVAPGQLTDDGELTTCLLQGIAESGEYAPDTVALWYGRWLCSDPFDVGASTRAGLAPALTHPLDDPSGLAVQMMASARAHNHGSKANGSLMRATPLGVWGHRLEPDALADVARTDSSLTHPNPACCDAVAAYSIAIAELVRSPRDRAGAFGRARAWADADGCEEVRVWLDDAEGGRRPAFRPQDGFVRIGFTEAFRHLLFGSSWERAVRETLLGGGDTDTNACIVGGLVGAAVGAHGVPQSARDAVIGADHAFGRQRPRWVHPRGVHCLVTRVLGN